LACLGNAAPRAGHGEVALVILRILGLVTQGMMSNDALRVSRAELAPYNPANALVSAYH